MNPQKPFTSEFEQEIRSAMAVPDSAPDFLAALKKQLLVKQPRQHLLSRLARPVWAGIFGVLTLIVVIILAVGPQRVMAAFQQLFGYVPGVGIVDIGQGQALAAPLEYSQNGVTLRVEELISTTDQTLLAFTLAGVPEGETVYAAHLQLPDGTDRYSSEYQVTGNPSNGAVYHVTEKFPPLSQGVTQIKVVWDRYANNQTRASDTIVISMQLQALTDELRARLYPPAYEPAQASDTQHAVTLQALQVASSPKTTVLKIQVQAPDTFSQIGIQRSVLTENTGQRYSQQPLDVQLSDQGQPVIRRTDNSGTWSIHQTLAYSPTLPGAESFTLSIDQLWFRSLIQRSLHVPLKAGAKIGDTWPVDLNLPVAGQTVHFSLAKLAQGDDQGTKIPVLELIPDPLTEDGGVKISFIQSNNDAKTLVGEEPSSPLVAVKLREDDLQSDVTVIFIDYIDGVLQGPWKISWQAPRP